MNIYREVVNRIEIPALPSLENGYYLLRFERNGTTSNVYAVVENESGMGVPITASVTEIGTGTPDPEAGEVLLAPGAWTLFFYEQVSGTNTNPDCSTIPLGQTEVTVYGEDAAVLSQTPTSCPSGPGGGITSVNGDSGPAVQLDAPDIPFTPFVSLQAGTFPGAYRATGLTGDGEPWYKLAGAAGPIDDGNNSIFYQGSNFWAISDATGSKMYQGTGADLLTATWTNTGSGALPLPSFVQIDATDVQAAVEEVAGEVAALGPIPKVYRALLSQTGTDAPTAVVLANTLGGTVVWTRNDVGYYTATLSNAFTHGKTWYNVLTTRDDSSSVGIGVTHDSVNAISVSSSVPATGFPSDDLLYSTPIEILVYL